ncbi:MAG: hypothetical protein LBG92_05675 [Prevotellaceae bacterium]|jgi:hypothetical protein|nr:hypothetical protein [Prevotellaceae bacterium]
MAENATLQEALKTLKAALKNAPDGAERAITPTVLAEILELVDAAKELFEQFAVTLSNAERRRTLGTGVKSIGFIQSAYLSAQTRSELMPSYLSLAQFSDDKDDFERKRELDSALSVFEKEAYDSMLVAGDVVYHDALAYYNTLKEAAKNKVPGAQHEFDLLKNYFHKSSSASAEPTEAQIERDVRSLLHGTKEGKIVIEKDIPAVEKAKLHVQDNVHLPNAAIDETVTEKLSEE